jgi:hypothetical protein
MLRARLVEPGCSRKLNHAIHMAAVAQIRYPDTPGRVSHETLHMTQSGFDLGRSPIWAIVIENC